MNPSTYTVTLGNFSGDGTLRLDLKASGTGIADLAGNPVAGGLAGQAALPVDGTAPTVASVSVPANGTYGPGQALDFTVTLSEAVVVDASGGTPRIAVTLDTGGTVYAVYVGGSGTNALVFRTTVQAGQLDATGVQLGAGIDLNGGTIKDPSGNNAVLALNGVPATAGALVDGVSPVVTSVAVPANAIYTAGDLLSFTVNTSEAVVVDTTGGVPRLAIDIGGATRFATYISGSGTGALLFAYRVQPSDNDQSGILVGASVDPNGGTLGDAAGNHLVRALIGVGVTSGVRVDGATPSVIAVAVPPDATYSAGSVLTFSLTTSEDVVVDTQGGVPRLAIDIGGATRHAGYVSGSGTSTLVFSYTVQAGDNDGDGINLGPVLDANGGLLRDTGGNNVVPALHGVPSTAGVLVDGAAGAPAVAAVSVPPDASYQAGDTLTFTVTTTENVTVDTSGGTPRLVIDIGGTTRYAGYVSGSGGGALVFSYTVQAADADADGIALGPAVDLNGGQIRDGVGNSLAPLLQGVANLGGVRVDGIPGAPSVVSVTVPANGNYQAGDVLSFTVGTSENVVVDTAGGVPRLAIDIGGSTRHAVYAGGSGTGALVFSYTVQAGDFDGDGIGMPFGIDYNGGQIRDGGGNPLNALLNGMPPTAGVLVDGVAQPPRVLGVAVPAEGAYGAGDALTFTVSTSDIVIVDTSGGTPRMVIDIGGATRYADYVSGSGGTTLVFSYTVRPGDSDGDGIALGGALDTNGGSLRGGNGANLNPLLTLVPGMPGVRVDTGGAPPVVTQVVATEAGGYGAGATLTFDVLVSQTVFVDTSGGSPRIELNFDGVIRYATYVSGSGTATLSFAYVVQPGDNDADGAQWGGSLQANGATLRDRLGRDMDLSLRNLSTSGAIVVDTVAPSAATLAPSPGARPTAQEIGYTVTFSEPVQGVDAGDFSLRTTGTVTASIGPVTAVDPKTYVVGVTGIAGSGNLTVQIVGSGSGITDKVGNPLGAGTVEGVLHAVAPPPAEPPAAPPPPVTAPPPPTAAPTPSEIGALPVVAPPPAPALATPVEPPSGGGAVQPPSVLSPPSPAAPLTIAGILGRPVEPGADLFIDTGRAGGQGGASAPYISLGEVRTTEALQSMPDLGAQTLNSGVPFSYSLPLSTFASNDPNAQITVEARQVDGRPLPSWMRFDARTGVVSGEPPPDWGQPVRLEIIARDNKGHRAVSVVEFDFRPGQATPARKGADAAQPDRRLEMIDTLLAHAAAWPGKDGAAEGSPSTAAGGPRQANGLQAQFARFGQAARETQRQALLAHLEAAARRQEGSVPH